jgi:hypothetical protein
MALKVDPLRVVRDPAYAASLTDAHWSALKNDPDWDELVGEYPEVVAPVLTLYAQQLNVPVPRTASAAARPAVEAPVESFNVVGRRIPACTDWALSPAWGNIPRTCACRGCCTPARCAARIPTPKWRA